MIRVGGGAALGLGLGFGVFVLAGDLLGRIDAQVGFDQPGIDDAAGKIVNDRVIGNARTCADGFDAAVANDDRAFNGLRSGFGDDSDAGQSMARRRLTPDVSVCGPCAGKGNEQKCERKGTRTRHGWRIPIRFRTYNARGKSSLAILDADHLAHLQEVPCGIAREEDSGRHHDSAIVAAIPRNGVHSRPYGALQSFRTRRPCTSKRSRCTALHSPAQSSNRPSA